MATNPPTCQMLEDARQAPERIAQLLASDTPTYEALGRKLRDLDPAVVGTIARGSSDHAAAYASYLVPLCTGKVVASIPPSVVSVLKAPLKLQRQFVLSISQSGRSPDILAAFEAARAGGAATAAIVNDLESPLARQAEFLLPQHAGSEGIAATKTVLCTLAALARLVAQWTGDKDLARGLAELPDALARAHLAGMSLDDSILKGARGAYVLSRGLGLSSALEIALKLKETCGTHAEAFSAAEVRHGPREIVDSGFLVIALAIPGSGQADVLTAAEELRAQGARVMTLDAGRIAPLTDPRLAPLLCLAQLYPWLARSSIALGFDPDRPKMLKSKVVKTH